MRIHPRFEPKFLNIAIVSIDCELQGKDADYQDHWKTIGPDERSPIHDFDR
ncbi:hypothetical protein GGQ71_002916 [Rhizobium taibaishanense]|uniref:Uncharacterized protein n=1 Tax=Allorhizobium taibaishanense TaxID=887144 RepID=A0A7W6HNW8_9HYPH|nr:hypothetical protein [Allorhizobium taibaishanense]